MFAIFLVLLFLRQSNAEYALTVPALIAADLAKCSSLEGLDQLAASLPQAKAEAKGQDAAAVAVAAQYWIWGYPLMNVAKAVTTTGIQSDAINKLHSETELVNAANQRKMDVVTPNTDTLYTTSWLDLSKGPIVLNAQDSKGRFYVLQLLDFWTNVIGNPGTPTTGTAASKWVILPPGFKKDTLPAQFKGLPAYSSNTTAVWVIGRVNLASQSDEAAAQAFQASIGMTFINQESAKASHLSTAASTATKLLQDAKWTLRTVANATKAFIAIAGLASAFPATRETAGPGLLAPKLGLQPAKGFEQPQLTPQQAAVLRAGFVVGQACINAFSLSDQLGVSQPTGWSYTTKAGVFGDYYLLRAAVALIGLAANSPDVTIYGVNAVDEKRQPLSGAKGAIYTITFPSIPPSKYFTSLTTYAVSDNLLMSNSDSNRSNINLKATPGLQYGKDGSLKLWLSAKPPGPKGSREYANWLPIAEVPFYTILRVYGPSQGLIDGKVPLPAFVRAR